MKSDQTILEEAKEDYEREKLIQEFMGKFTYEAGDGDRMATSPQIPGKILTWVQGKIDTLLKENRQLQESIRHFNEERLRLKAELLQIKSQLEREANECKEWNKKFIEIEKELSHLSQEKAKAFDEGIDLYEEELREDNRLGLKHRPENPYKK